MLTLDTKDYDKAGIALNGVKINTLFAKAVIEQRIPGVIYVDDLRVPTTFYVAHPYGMSLLYGELGNEQFKQALLKYITEHHRQSPEWLQVDPASGWIDVIESFVATQASIVKNTRVNFSFNREKYQMKKQHCPTLNHDIVRLTNELYMSQAGTVVPTNFWRDADQFLTIGIGFSLVYEGEVSSTAFSAFRTEYQLEIGIETLDAHRGKGHAYAVSSALIDYCLNHQLEPVWSCRLENEGSYKLAQRLGFEPTITIPYYQLT